MNIKLLEDIGLDIVYDGDIRSFDNKYYKKARCLNRVTLRENYPLRSSYLLNSMQRRM